MLSAFLFVEFDEDVVSLDAYVGEGGGDEGVDVGELGAVFDGFC